MTRGTYVDKDGNATDITIDTSIVTEVIKGNGMTELFPEPAAIKTEPTLLTALDAQNPGLHSRIETVSVGNAIVIGAILGAHLALMLVLIMDYTGLVRWAAVATVVFTAFFIYQNLFRRTVMRWRRKGKR